MLQRIACVVLSVGLASGGAAWAGDDDVVRVLHCGTLLAVPGDAPNEEATIVVANGRIEKVLDGFVDAAEAAPDRKAEVIDLRAMFVMPGWIDCHTHVTMELGRDVRLRAVEESDADLTMRGVVNARKTLDAGFTTVRDLGSSGDAVFALRDAIARGDVPGPRILTAGESVSPTGGHSDSTNGYRDDLYAMPSAIQGIADGPDECRKAVRAQVKRGADVIKMTATGGVLSATAAGTEQQFFDDELVAIVETSHLLGRKIAAHAHGVRGINAALRAGVDSIEHGSYLDEESIRLFRQTGAFLVPTLMAGETVAKHADEEGYFVPAVAEKARRVGPVMMDAFRRAHEGGVRIAFGTDCGVGPHGENAREFLLMVEGGMSQANALKAATVDAAELCGLGGEVGTLEAGRRADIIALGSSPLKSMDAVLDVRFVMAHGRVHKAP
jgi:imidazolonepropionase-like amidohydrolase